MSSQGRTVNYWYAPEGGPRWRNTGRPSNHDRGCGAPPLRSATARSRSLRRSSPRLGQFLDAGALIFRKALHGQASSLRCAPQDARADQRSRLILPAALILLGKAYPAHHTPGVEVSGELALVFVARHQHDNAPLVDVLEVDGGCGPQIAREGFCGLEHHLLPDPCLGDLPFVARGSGPLPVHHYALPSFYVALTL